MKIFKKCTVWLVMSVLLLTFSVSAYASKSFIYFKDVKRGSWYYNDVVDMVSYGYFYGEGDLTYKPENFMTRAMFVTVLGRIFGLTPEYYSGKRYFADIGIDDWFTPYVNWAYEYGITAGTSHKKFSPNLKITREEMATLLFRSCQIMNTPLKNVRPVQKFVDAKSISSWAKTAVNYLSRAGILYGDTQQRFNPKSSTTRAEATALFSRYLNAAQLPKRKLSNYLPDTSCILHAGGLADGVMYSNSKEALSQSYAAGARLIEIDFNYTSDGYLACIHDWHNRFAPEIKTNVAPSLNSFLSMKIFNRFTPMWLGSVAEFMNEHSDVYIVTDIKEQNVRAATEIKKAYPHLMDRFIIQVYSEQEYHAIKKLGFDHIIFSLYKLTWAEKTDFDHLVSFAKKNKILAYTFDYTLLSVSGYYERISKAGVPLFVHTINTASMQKDYYKMGIYGIYSDMLLK